MVKKCIITIISVNDTRIQPFGGIMVHRIVQATDTPERSDIELL